MLKESFEFLKQLATALYPEPDESVLQNSILYIKMYQLISFHLRHIHHSCLFTSEFLKKRPCVPCVLYALPISFSWTSSCNYRHSKFKLKISLCGVLKFPVIESYPNILHPSYPNILLIALFSNTIIVLFLMIEDNKTPYKTGGKNCGSAYFNFCCFREQTRR
jgi:hypothetical protein